MGCIVEKLQPVSAPHPKTSHPPPLHPAQTKDVMLGRVGNTREIANATLFFACEESSYCTATHLMVDGGQTPCTIME